MVEAIYGADEVRVYEVALPAVQSGLNRGLGGTFNKQVETSRLGKIFRVPDIAMAKFDAPLRQPAQRQFAALPLQVIQRDDCAVRLLPLE